MNTRPISLAIVLLLLVGAQSILMGASSPVEAELPTLLIETSESAETVMVTVDAFSRIRLPIEMPRYDIPLSLQLQKHIWELCQEHDLSYEFVLGVIKAESDFVVDAVGVTKDLGLMQLNPYNTMDWLAEKVGISDFDPFNPFHNVTAGIWYLAHIRDYWAKFGICQQRTFAQILLSYNRGIGGATQYIRQMGERAYQHVYVMKVVQFKQELESGLQ